MKPLMHPVPIACLLIAVLSGIMGNLPVMLLSLLAGVASVGLLSARAAQSGRAEHYEDLSAESRILLSPVKKLAADIETIIDTNKDSEVIRIIGAEALTESQKLQAQVAKSLSMRDDLTRTLKGRAVAERAVREAEAKLPSASEEEKESLTTLIQSRTMEIQHYGEIEKQVKRLEVGITQAEAALAEMKARLSLSASSERATSGEGDDLRATIGRMKNLNESYEESAQMIQGP
jgi:hypothetical protein